MKKILIIAQNFYPEIGSAGNRMKNIYSLIKDLNYEVEVLTTEPTYPNHNFYHEEQFWDNEELNIDENIHRIKINTRKYSISIINRLLYYLEIALKMFFYVIKDKNKYDIVFTTSPAIFIAVIGLFAKYRYKSRLVLEIRDLWPESLKGVGVFDNPIIIQAFKWIEKLLYTKASDIIVNSKGFIEYISAQSTSFRKKITYIPNGARKEELMSKKRTNQDFRVIFAGNIGRAQDEKIVKKLIPLLYKLNIELTFIGYGLSKDGLVEFIKENGYSNVNFLKATTRKECFEIIAKHHVGLVTLNNNNVFETVLPGRIIDYMTCSVPMVASVSGLSKEVITNENVGFVIQDQNVDEMISYIEKLRNDPNLQQEMGKNGQEYVKSNFLWENNVHLLVDIFKK